MLRSIVRGGRRWSNALQAVGPRQLPVALASDLRFRLARWERRSAERQLAECESGSDYYRFASAHLPGNIAYGAGASQIENEILPMLRFAAEREPRTVVEIGTQTGGTTFLMGALLPTVELVIGMDMFVRNTPRLRAFARSSLELRFLNGDSSSAELRSTLDSCLGGRAIDLLFIDGDHSFAGVLADFRFYSRFVKTDGLIAFHDIVADDTLRTGEARGTWAGEVPILWDILKHQYTSREFVDSWEQQGSGIGLLEYDSSIVPSVAPSRGGVSERA